MPSFTLDTPLTLSNAVAFQTTGASAPLTVAAPITVTGSGGLGLYAAGDLNILNTVSVPNGGTVALSYGGDYSFGLTAAGFTGNIDFGGTDNGAHLAINGSVYTLKYTMAQLARDRRELQPIRVGHRSDRDDELRLRCRQLLRQLHRPRPYH